VVAAAAVVEFMAFSVALKPGGLLRRCVQKDYGPEGVRSFLGIFRFFFRPGNRGKASSCECTGLLDVPITV
jgi:hypothetical protein